MLTFKFLHPGSAGAVLYHPLMPVRHLVLFALRKDLPKSQRDGLMEELRRLEQDIDIVSNVTVGLDISQRSEYGLAFTCDLPSVQSIQEYLAHPAHIAVVENHVRPACKRWSVVDYEV